MVAVELPRDTDGQLSKWAWPGGYPLFYFDSDNAVICADCARKWNEYSTDIIAADVNWKDASLYCENCEKQIEAAYA
jgi:hypothetical protein